MNNFRRFEYMILYTKGKNEHTELSNAGKEGWELVSVDRNPNDAYQVRFYMKREIQ